MVGTNAVLWRLDESSVHEVDITGKAASLVSGAPVAGHLKVSVLHCRCLSLSLSLFHAHTHTRTHSHAHTHAHIHTVRDDRHGHEDAGLHHQHYWRARYRAERRPELGICVQSLRGIRTT